jgi:hypothetical protein
MSILRVDAIRDNGSGFNDVVTFANSGGTENAKMARAWVNFNGSGTVAIRGQFNVNTISDNGSGDYTINFASSLTDGNYSCVGACGNSSFGGMAFQTAQKSAGGTAIVEPTSSALRCTMGQANVGYQDVEHVHAVVFR